MTPNMVSIQPSFLLIASASDSPRRCGFTRNYSHAISLLIMVLSVPGSNPGGRAMPNPRLFLTFRMTAITGFATNFENQSLRHLHGTRAYVTDMGPPAVGGVSQP